MLTRIPGINHLDCAYHVMMYQCMDIRSPHCVTSTTLDKEISLTLLTILIHFIWSNHLPMPTAWHSDTAYPGEGRSFKYVVALTGSDDGGFTLAEVLCKEHPFQASSISRLVGITLRRRAFCFWQVLVRPCGGALCAEAVEHCLPGTAWPLPS